MVLLITIMMYYPRSYNFSPSKPRKITHSRGHFPQDRRFYFSQARCFRVAHLLR